ncbi:hypothetical protein SCLCIDRAFT_1137118 [Scleroderma citrinum Foug A]|uniref:Uncharacterized protein n=1 Tax=Scleroderma citrinum Foug A TaxID=1036808 RepID=A0A0C3DMG5_9AGAM|nr:hypothetical protein SCLCIDRAFT_1137118 [Scleroderma citrinum Foug A]
MLTGAGLRSKRGKGMHGTQSGTTYRTRGPNASRTEFCPNLLYTANIGAHHRSGCMDALITRHSICTRSTRVNTVESPAKVPGIPVRTRRWSPSTFQLTSRAPRDRHV